MVAGLSDNDFESVVLQQSHTVPVVLCFLSRYGHGGISLSGRPPVIALLERLATQDAAFKGRFLLALVQGGDAPRVAQTFAIPNAISSLPCVFAVIRGEAYPQFQGSASEMQVRTCLEDMLDAAKSQGIVGRLDAITLGPSPISLERLVSPSGQPTGPARLFISHASEDADIASAITGELGRNGVATWLASRDLQVGDNYAAQIYSAIVDCTHICVLLSPASIASQHVEREINLALDQGKGILPLGVAASADFMGTLPAQWKYWLGVVQVVPYAGASHSASMLLSRLQSGA